MTPRPPTRKLAPYGLACMQCFKSKCRCVGLPDGTGCERCHRLQKQCHPSDPLRRNTAWRKHSSQSKTASLEGKVDSLVRLLNRVAQSPDASTSLHSAMHTNDVPPGLEHQLAADRQAAHSSVMAYCTPLDHGAAASAAGSSQPPIDASPSYLSDYDSTTDATESPALSSMPSSIKDCEACLATFRNDLLPTFPFIHLDKDTTVSGLRRDRPFLLRAIVAVASPFKEQKMAQGQELKRVMAQAVLVQNQLSIDLLLGLLVYTTWSYDHVFTQSSSPSRLTMMAMSIACELRLDKQLPPDEHMMKPMVDGHETWIAGSKCMKMRLESEEQRAVLACYTLSSMIAIYFAQIDAMKWKPRMEDSLRALEVNNECHADAAFAIQVRLQILAQKAVQARDLQHSESGSLHSASLYLRTLQTELKRLEASLPSSLQRRGPLLMHLHYTELCINDTARSICSGTPQTPALGPRSSTISSSSTLSYDLLDFSWRCVNAIKAWAEVFFSLMPAETAGLSFVHAAQLARCVLVLYRLSTSTSPGWDNALVRRTLDLMTFLDNVAERFETASRHVGERLPDDLLMRIVGTIRKCYATASVKMGPKPSLLDDSAWIEGSTEAAQSEPSTGDTQTLLQPMGDDTFLESIFEEIGLGWSF